MNDPMYPAFADWARKHGLEAAVSAFSSAPAVEAYKHQFEADRARVQEGGPIVIAAVADDWYGGAHASDKFWPSLKAHLVAEGWGGDRLQSLDDASTKVVAHTPRPGLKAWRSKGLVVGYVQSGKTTNFTAVAAKLADLDYKLIIVLSGIHNGLRRQTQLRLDEQLRGLNPDHWLPLTEDQWDFKPPPSAPGALLNQGDKAVLVVAKKNVVVLKRLVKWLDSVNGAAALRHAPVAIIDDEADQASVATSKINPLIRRLIALAPKCTYIGYTATPFANVFIDPSNSDDLYPRDFILNLPQPSGYYGPEQIFGREGDAADPNGAVGLDIIRSIPEAEVPSLRPPARQAASWEPTLTASLEAAVRWFLMATAARAARGDVGHSTMLIHSSVNTTVHEKFREPLDDLLSDMARALRGGEDEDWRQQWHNETQCVPAAAVGGEVETSFDDLEAHLHELLGVDGDDPVVRVVLDNSRSQDRLKYDGGRVVAIVVGGNTLSRGLTLEGLVTSVFVRSATTYDTLLQMGRWFGYRPGYADLPRLWTTDELASNFRHLAAVEHEMRQEIEGYQLQNVSPIDVAVRIRTHPVLQVTSKMGGAKPAYVDFAGRRLQTRYFRHRDADWLEGNLRAAEDLVADAQRYGGRSDGGSILFREVPARTILAFLDRYQVHEDSPDLDTNMLASYIRKASEAETPSLERWSVAVVEGGVSGSGDMTRLAGHRVKSVIRSRVNAEGDRADIKTLMSKSDRVLDLAMTTAEARSLKEYQLVAARNDDDNHKDKGLLVLYPIDALSPPDQPNEVGRSPRYPLDAVSTVMGVGFVFPGAPQEGRGVRPSYVAVDTSDVDDELEADVEAQISEDTEGLL